MFLSPNALLPALEINVRRDIEESSAGQFFSSPLDPSRHGVGAAGRVPGAGPQSPSEREGELQIRPQLVAPRFPHI